MGILDNMPHTCTAKRRTRSQGSMGGGKDTLTTIFADRSCWRQPATDAEILKMKKRDIDVDYKIYFTSDPGLDEQDIVFMNGDRMEVRSTPEPDSSAGLGVVWKIMVKRRKE